MINGMRVKEIRKERKITQRELANMVKIGESTLSCIEKGKNYPKIVTAIRIANALGVETKEIWE